MELNAKVVLVTPSGLDVDYLVATLCDEGRFAIDRQEFDAAKIGANAFRVEVAGIEPLRGALIHLPLVDDRHLLALTEDILRCELPAIAKRADFGSATHIMQSGQDFNALAYLARLDLHDVVKLFERPDEAWPRINGQEHSGMPGYPFKASVDEEELVRQVCLLSGHHGALGQDDFVSDFTPDMWDDFAMNVFQIEAVKQDASQAPKPATEAPSA